MANKPNKELGGPRQMSKGTKIVIGIFAVIMALSMMLPSLSSIFAGATSSSEQEESEEQADEQTAEESEESSGESTEKEDGEDKTEDESKAEDDATANVPDNDTLKSLAEQNESAVKKFEGRLEEDPKNLAALLNLGQTYMNWGYSALYSSSTDEEKAYSNDLLNKAIEYFDKYLEIQDSDAARVQRISAQYYLGETQESVDAMKKITEEKPDYPLAWAHLGLFYEWQYDFTNAKAAYNKAIETDPNDEYGVKSFSEEHIANIDSYSADFSKLTNEELLGTNAKPQEGLPGVIANNTDVSNN